MLHCRSFINLQTLLEDDVENGINMLQKCLSYCQTYKTICNKVRIHVKV